MSIRFESVSKSFGTKSILREVSFEIAKGEILFILGKSGVGKSVTLKHIIGVLKPDSGKVWVEDSDVTTQNEEGLEAIRRECGMVFQHPALLDSLTVFENVAFGLKRFRMDESQIRERVLEKLALVNLGADILEKRPPEISYGMQKRVSLARTLAPEPSYLLFDEPTTGLDPVTTTAINELILELSRKLHVTSVVVSHDMGSAMKVADKILVLDQGKILAWGTVAQMKASKEPLIRDFLCEALTESQEGTRE